MKDEPQDAVAIAKDLVAASAGPMVLAILARGESYGYEIIQEVRKRSGGRLAWTDGMLYPILHRLEDRGLVRSDWRESPEGRRRKYYRLIERGRSELAEQRTQWMLIHGTLAALWEE